MASSGRARKTRRGRRKQEVMNKKQSQKQRKQKEVTSIIAEIDASCSTKDPACESVCSTPKGHKFRIPEISTCPPAPKKQRLLTNFSLRKSLSFYSPPDLDAFFRLALQDVSVPLIF